MTRLDTPMAALAALSICLVAVTAGAVPAKKPADAAAAGKPASSGKPAAGVPLLPGSGSKEPINITADKLDYLSKENKLVYTGNVVAVQGDSTLKASVLHIDLQKADPAAGGAAAPTTSPAATDVGPGQGSTVSHMEADGPVTLISKDQIGTGDHGTYDKAENKVYLKGNVTLSQGPNVTQGDHLVYDMTSGEAQVFPGPNGPRVISVFTPQSGGATGADAAKAAPKPAPAKPAAAKRKTAGRTPKTDTAADRGGDAAAQ